MSRVLCDTPFWPGDAHEAAAPVEASFWTTHGTVERLLQYKDIVRPFEDKSWDGSKENKVEKAGVCVDYKWDGFGETTDEEGTCKGHNAADLTFWRGVYQDTSGAFKLTRLSNEETKHAVLPATGAYGMSYL